MDQRWDVEFYETAAGRSVVSDALGELDAQARARVIARLQVLSEHGLRLGFPHVRALTGYSPLRELRITHNKVEFRLVFFPRGRKLVAVHFFQKQSNRAPPDVLATAMDRAKDWLRSHPL